MNVDELIYAHTLTLNKESCLHSFVIDTGNDMTMQALGSPENQEIVKLQDRRDQPRLPEWMKREIALYALPLQQLTVALGYGWKNFEADHKGDKDLPPQEVVYKFRI